MPRAPDEPAQEGGQRERRGDAEQRARAAARQADDVVAARALGVGLLQQVRRQLGRRAGLDQQVVDALAGARPPRG